VPRGQTVQRIFRHALMRLKAGDQAPRVSSTASLSFRCRQAAGWPPTSSLSGDRTRLQSGRHLLRGWRLLEPLDEPTPRRSRRTIGPINRPHVYQASSGWGIIGRDFNEGAACQVRLDSVQRHAAEPEARAQERKLGAEVGKAPDSRDLKQGFVASRDIGKINVRDPNVFRKSS
jgi:hypothetical protein